MGIQIDDFLNGYLKSRPLKNFYIALQKCTDCKLAALYVNKLNLNEDAGKLPGYGNCKSSMIFIAQQPAFNRKGHKVFGGDNANDNLFNKGLEHIGVERKDVFVTNLVKCSQLDNGSIGQDIIKTCVNNHLITELRLLQPRLIIAVGSLAKNAFDAEYGESKVCNPRFQTGFSHIVAIHHPAYILRGGMKRTDYMKEFTQLKKIIKRYSL